MGLASFRCLLSIRVCTHCAKSLHGSKDESFSPKSLSSRNPRSEFLIADVAMCGKDNVLSLLPPNDPKHESDILSVVSKYGKENFVFQNLNSFSSCCKVWDDIF